MVQNRNVTKYWCIVQGVIAVKCGLQVKILRMIKLFFTFNVWCFVAIQLRLMREMRESIIAGCFPEFVQRFFVTLFPSRNYPAWAVDALNSVNIRLQLEDFKECSVAE